MSRERFEEEINYMKNPTKSGGKKKIKNQQDIQIPWSYATPHQLI